LTHFLADDSIVRFAPKTNRSGPQHRTKGEGPKSTPQALSVNPFVSTNPGDLLSCHGGMGGAFSVSKAFLMPGAEAGNATLRWFGRRLDMRGEIEEEYELDEIARESAVAEKSAVAGKVRSTCLFLSL